MSLGLRIDPRDAVPIWKQIEDSLRRMVASGALAPGAPVPSVRDLARDLGVNPATVSKGYQGLCDAGILDVRRGAGTFVSGAPPVRFRGERTRELKEAAGRYVAVAATIGAEVDEALDHVRGAWPRERPKGGAR
jgi:DNA-binding transcriptional regulator YhcF (GntR family)